MIASCEIMNFRASDDSNTIEMKKFVVQNGTFLPNKDHTYHMS